MKEIYKVVVSVLAECPGFTLGYDKLVEAREVMEDQLGCSAVMTDDYYFSSQEDKDEVWSFIEDNEAQVRNDVRTSVKNQLNFELKNGWITQDTADETLAKL